MGSTMDLSPLQKKDQRFEYYQTSIAKEKDIDKPINFINAELSVIINKLSLKLYF